MALKYSANIGFLWENLSLPERIEAASKAGFDAVECHFPYEYDAREIASVLKTNRIPMIGLNTFLGPADEALFGVAAVVGKEELARQYIDQAIDYATRVGAINVNVIAGASAANPTSESVFQENLKYACKRAALSTITIVIEPLNPRAVSQYHFSRVEQAIATIDSVDEPNLKLMFDCFHAQIVQCDLAELLTRNLQHIGHIQISAVHDRGEPDVGEVNYPYLMALLLDKGYLGYIGAEYKPRGPSVEAGLGWLESFRQL